MEVADAGFTVTRNFDSPLTVTSVNENGKAAKAGLVEGDMLLEVNGEISGPDIEQALSRLHPGDKIKIRIRNRNGDRVLSWKLDARQEVEFQLRDLPDVSAVQKSRRAAWLRGESEPTGETQP
jgi:predicted metalloprotease with PDZ domain